MPSGLPDWSMVKTSLDFEYSNDSAELAARLGATTRYYRSGNVVFMTSFEDGDDYVKYFSTGASGVVAPTTAQALYGEKSLEMAADPAGTVCEIEKMLPYHVGGIVGLSVAIDRALLTNHFYLRYQYAKGSTYKQAQLIYNFVTKKFGVLDDLVAYHYQGDAYDEAFSGNPSWFSIKLYINTITGKYFALNLNDTLFDISDINLYESSNLYQDHVKISVIVEKPASVVSRCYVDNLIYTINDPS